MTITLQQYDLPVSITSVISQKSLRPENDHGRCFGAIAKRYATKRGNYVAMSTNYSIDNTAMSTFLWPCSMLCPRFCGSVPCYPSKRKWIEM